jgi:DNA-binding response OmpR family regulator
MSSRLVLVVEDDDLLRELIATALEIRGYTVQTAANVVEAKRLFHATDPDGLVLDVDLGPGPNGFDFAQTALKDAPGTGVVFLTQLPDPRFAVENEQGLPNGIA